MRREHERHVPAGIPAVLALAACGWLLAAAGCGDDETDTPLPDGGADRPEASWPRDAGRDAGDGAADAQAPPSGCWNQVPELGAVSFWIAPDGSDDNQGTQDAPFATPARAAEAVRALLSQGVNEPVTVVFRQGVYFLGESWELGREDSGPDEERPVTWRSYPGEEVVLTGARLLEPGWFQPLGGDDPLSDRIPQEVRSEVLVADLAAHGITDYGRLHPRGFSSSNQWGAELLVDWRPAELAGWPNRGQTDPLDETRPALVRGDIFGQDGTVFEAMGTQASGNADDGYPNYRAEVDGTVYYLYHCTWFYNEQLNRYWFVSTADPRTEPNCWPSDRTAWGASGTDPIPRLRPLFGGAAEPLFASNRPGDFALHGFAWFQTKYSDTEFQLPGERWQRWLEAEDPWFWGLFRHLWADNTLPGIIDGTGRVVLQEAPTYGIGEVRPFRVLNLVEELDSPGEYYLDRATGRLYYLPEADPAESRIALTLADGPLLALRDASHLRFEGITFAGSRGELVSALGVQDVTFSRCRFLAAGATALHVRGSRSGLACSQVRDAGGNAVVLECGHRADLTRGECFVRDSDLGSFGRLDRTYHVGVRVRGCGQVVEHNFIHDAPHTAILFTGNEHTIAFNEIARVVLEASDAGAIYTGRDWGYRGNEIRFNWIHDVGGAFLGGIHAVYLDDASSGIRVFGNILTNIAGAATMSGGGRDNLFENNVIVHVQGPAHFTDRRARTSNHDFNNGVPDSWNLLGRLHFNFSSYEWGAELAYQQEPWLSAYPALAAIPDDWDQVRDSHWQDPEGCIFSRNLIFDTEGFIGEGTWGGAGAISCYAEIQDNLQGRDPGFVDEANGDLNLRPDSPAFEIPGFQPIPFDEIGPR